MDKLTFKEILRYFLSGATYIYVYFLVADKKIHDNNAVLFVLALLFGCIIYVLHRSFIYPILYRCILRCRTPKENRKSIHFFAIVKPTNIEVERDLKRWKRLTKKKSIQHKLIDWGSEIHFHYCITWAILFAFLTKIIIINLQMENIKFIILCIIFLVLGSTAIINNIRFLWYEDAIIKKRHKAKKTENKET